MFILIFNCQKKEQENIESLGFSGSFSKLWNPVLKGKPSGIPVTIVFLLDTMEVDSSYWLLSDTTSNAALANTFEQEMEVIDIKLHGRHLDTNDTAWVHLYAFNLADSTVETLIAPTDSIYATQPSVDDMTISSSYKIIDPDDEVLCIEVKSGKNVAMDDVEIILELETRINDIE